MLFRIKAITLLMNLCLVLSSYAEDCLREAQVQHVPQIMENIEDILKASHSEALHNLENPESCIAQHIERNPQFNQTQVATGTMLAVATLASTPVGILGGLLSFGVGPLYNMRHEKKLFKVVAQAYLGEGKEFTKFHKKIEKKAGIKIDKEQLKSKLIEIDSSGYLCSSQKEDCPEEVRYKGRCGVTAFGHAEMDYNVRDYFVHLYRTNHL
jgi:hypothetical protein